MQENEIKFAHECRQRNALESKVHIKCGVHNQIQGIEMKRVGLYSGHVH